MTSALDQRVGEQRRPAADFEPQRPEASESHDGDIPGLDRILAAITQQQATQRLPTATYRVQLSGQNTFRDVLAAVPYFDALGISDLYLSPFLEARPGSLHGYDVVRHTAINPEIGTLEELRGLRAALRERGMGLIEDVVPNHMSNAPRWNAWWEDVLENGPSSVYASYFDIDWMPLKPDLAYKVLLPVLGEQFGKVLEEGQLAVRYGGGAFWLEYFDQRFPLAPGSYGVILAPRLPELQAQIGEDHPDLLELLSILTSARNLPPRTETDPERLAERRREKDIMKRRLHELVDRSTPVSEYLAESLRCLNGAPGDSRSFDWLDDLLQRQAYRLAYWRVAADEINYRRFFDVNELAAICTEQPRVFAETHRLLFELLNENTLTGLRIDHPDGLYDPRSYLCQLQEEHFVRLCRQQQASREQPVPAEPQTWQDRPAGGDGPDRPEDTHPAIDERLRELWRTAAAIPGSPLGRLLYVVVEKILARGESLPDNWPVHGTVGYEFLNAVNGLFVAPTGERLLSALYTRFTGESLDFDSLAYQCKRLIVKMSMGSELHVLGHQLDRISERNRWTRDFTLSSLTRALQEVVACFGVYRTYVESGQVLERDSHYLGRAVALAKRHNPAMSASVFDFVHDVLLLHYHDNADEEERRAVQRFAGKFQQLTGPIMAKAVEDTAFYRYNRLVSLNEVGGNPARFGTSLEEFHQLNRSRLPRWAHTLNATSTHDTKRSEDVRARIDVLSEIGGEWRDRVQRWSRWHRRLKIEVDGSEAPSRNAEYLLYQTLVGIWHGQIPSGDERGAFQHRVQQYMLKVVREAKVNTSWVSPHEAYEAALSQFVAALLTNDRRRPFLPDLNQFARRVAKHGRWNSLSQVVLKIGSPGVPDFYQGTDRWLLALVDPDNRQPVDLAANSRSLDRLLASMGEATGPARRLAHFTRWADDKSGSPEPHDSGRVQTLHNPMAIACRELLDTSEDGRIKQFVTLIGLQARRCFPELFCEGEYLPLEPRGKFSEHVVAFARRHEEQVAVVLVPRLMVGITGFGGPTPLSELWGDTAIELPEGLTRRALHNCFTREASPPGASSLPLSAALHSFPVALYVTPKDPG